MVFYDFIKVGTVYAELCAQLIDVYIVHIVITQIIQHIGKVSAFKAFLPFFFLPIKTRKKQIAPTVQLQLFQFDIGLFRLSPDG